MSTSNLQRLLNERASIWDQMCKLMDEHGPELPAEHAETYDRLETELDAKGKSIARAEAHQKLEDGLNAVDRTGVVPADDVELGDEPEKGYSEAFAKFLRGGVVNMTREDQATLQAGFVKDDAIRNAQGVGTGAAGGYTVPPAFRQKLIEQLTFVASMRRLAEVITTETGADLPWPTVDDTANEGAILGENTQASEQDVEFGQGSIGAYMYTSKIVRASIQLLNDNAFDFERWLAGALARRIGRVQNRHFTVGTGTNQPDGVVTSAPVGVTAAAVADIEYDELVDLTESLDPEYLNGGNVGFMLSQVARGKLRKLRDGDDRPLWQPSLQVGAPDTLLGYGIELNNYVPVPATGAKSVVFGDIREAYLIRDVQDFMILRLAERYADFLQVGFIGFQRSDGTLQNSAAVRTLQQA